MYVSNSADNNKSKTNSYLVYFCSTVLVHLLLVLHLALLVLVVDALDVQHIIAPDQHLAKISCAFTHKQNGTNITSH